MTRHLSVLMSLMAVGLLLAPLAHVGVGPRAPIGQAFGVLLVLAAISLARGPADASGPAASSKPSDSAEPRRSPGPGRKTP